MPYKLARRGTKYCVVKGKGEIVKCHKDKKSALKHLKALKINVSDAQGAGPQLQVSISNAIAAMSAIEALQGAKPQLTTVPDVQIVKTGIEYPLSSGPATFTKEDLADAVAAQYDPSVPQPRIWIGHYDDDRIHGSRVLGTPSGEPALGKVTDMRLEDDGNTILGNLTGVPVWLANIMSSAFPSRSIEGRFNIKTVTGHRWRLVINGLALLGVVWPGVTTIEDIAALYTKKGPKVDVTTATPEMPVTIVAAADRPVAAQVTVEDLRRQWYDANSSDPDKKWWWIRGIYLSPNEMIIDADDGGTLLKQGFDIKGEKVTFGKEKKVKIKYVNAAHGGIEVEPLNAEKQHVALFASREESQPEEDSENTITVVLGRASASGSMGDTITVKLGKD